MQTRIITEKSDMADSAAEPTVRAALSALDKATQYSVDQMKEGTHWCGELRSNPTVTAEYVFLQQALGLSIAEQAAQPLIQWLLSQQNPDGSWGIAPNYPGDVSTSTEAYFALKILQFPAHHTVMQNAREYIRSVGGVAKVRIFTRFYLAMFGLFPWEAVPELPAELILMPDWAPINIYRFSSWARSTIVPLLIVSHHRPVYSLPPLGSRGDPAASTFLDELWLDPSIKMVPYQQQPASSNSSGGSDRLATVFLVIDRILHSLDGLRFLPFIRGYSRRSCISWILEHQEDSGDWAGIFPPMHLGLLALTLEGFKITDPRVVKGLEAVERFSWEDHQGRRIQACVSPTWDTILMSIALCDASLTSFPSSSHTENCRKLQSAIDWIRNRQLVTQPYGDWRVYSANKAAQGGGFSFEYFNTWYPDVDDTAAAIIAFLKHGSSSSSSLDKTHYSVTRAVHWILGMQNKDGGWGAFDINNDALFLNKIPFSDMDSLCDPSSADVTGRVLEAFGLLVFQSPDSACARISSEFLSQILRASDRAIEYLARNQESNGSWYGRWDTNSNINSIYIPALTTPAVQWIMSIQNRDGGWGESLESYRYPSSDRLEIDHHLSTASQTAWAVMALLPYFNLAPDVGTAIEHGVGYLIKTQTKQEQEGRDSGSGAATWEETTYTGTGFPNFFYIGYAFYPHYFPMMALGRYVRLASGLRTTSGVASGKKCDVLA
ncbi:squalene--hopene cyclase [Aspergillus udagawae]|uniref:Terpene cyclase/mutase family member n=1 Tax=Aspergillus udagawae TaxID=91492 RepID=A0A8H3SD65_9EURO|nr:squalene--hopene cyclase [Aspergillus udagawae]